MKWQSLLQANRPTCQPLISDDHKLCFLAGLPLSIHVYSNQSSLLISSLTLSDSQNLKSKLVNILRHPTSPQQLIILVSSTGCIYFFDFIRNSLAATYDTHLLTTHAALRPPINSSNPPSSTNPSPQSNPPLTIFLVTQKLPQPLNNKLPPSRFKNPPKKSKKRLLSIIYAIKLHSLPPSQENQAIPHYPEQSIDKICLLKVDPISTFSSSHCGSWLGVVTGFNLWIIRIKPVNLFDNSDNKRSKVESVHLSTPERITSIAFPPKAHADRTSRYSNHLSTVPCDFFATGSISGKIALWHALSEAQWSRFSELTARNPGFALPCPTSVSHWHSHAVADLVFTPNGSHLLSGGEEAVLVLWRLDDFSGIGSDSKTFLPRLGTEISSISLIQTLDNLNQPIALVTGHDGIIMIVNIASMSLSKTLKLPRMYQLPPVYKTTTDPILLPISFEPNYAQKKPYGNLLLQSSHPCGLQILDGGTGNVLDEIFVSPKNMVSRRGRRPIVEPKLLFASLGGVQDRYLGTIDTWVDEDRGFTPEITLKLWERDDENSNRFQVIARVDNPHDDTQITSLKLTTESVPKLITTSIDGTLKIWTSSSGSSHGLNVVPNAITSATTSLGKIKKSAQEAFENVNSIKLKFKNYGILKSRISKDNSILIVLHRHPSQNIISIWDLIHLEFLDSFMLDSPSIKLNSLLDFHESNKKNNYSNLKKFHIQDLDFIGDKNQFIIVLGNFGCGLLDLLTGSEIAFWKCKPRFMIKTTDETKVVIIHEKRMTAKEELSAKEEPSAGEKPSAKEEPSAGEKPSAKEEPSAKETDETENKPKQKASKQKETINKKRSKTTMMAIIDVLEKKILMNHKIREVISGRFIPTNKNREDSTSATKKSHSSESLTKEEILDGLVLVSKTAGLMRAGSEIKENDLYLITNRTLEIERQVGISSALPFQEIFTNDYREPVEIHEVHRSPLDHRVKGLQSSDHYPEKWNLDYEVNREIESLINLSPHLIPPIRLIWSKLIQPNGPKAITPSPNEDKNGLFSIKQKEKDKPSSSSIQNLEPSDNLPTADADTVKLDHRALSPLPLAEFNRRLLSNIPNPPLNAFQLLDQN